MSKPRKRWSAVAIIGRILFVLVTTAFLCVLFAAGTIAGLIYAYSRNLPDINKMADFQPSRATRVYARDGTQLASLFHQNRIWVPITKIPQRVRNAFVATEDRNFYQHHGVDFYGIVRAAYADYRHEEFQGASTITQQLARALFLSGEISISRKVQEALLAMEIERYYTKDEILERYLNLIYFGSGAYGIEAAAHTYFGRDVGSVDIAQAAILAGLPAAPSDYSPYVSMSRALKRQHHVLERMVASGYITHAQQVVAEEEPIHLVGERRTGLLSFRYPYFTTYVQHMLEKQFGVQATYEGGLEVDTTLDPRMQNIAEEAVDWGVQSAVGEGIGAHEAALVAIRPSTGEILAMVGGAGGFSLKHQFNRAWQAERQPGSSFKGFVYSAAIDSGMPPTTLVDDAPTSYPMGDGSYWRPMDDDFAYLGPITLRYALAQSRNIVAVKVAQMVGVDRVIEYAHRMGVETPLEPNLSMALGSSVVTPLDMAAGYATIADQGIHIQPSAIRLVKDSVGSPILDDRFPAETEVFGAGTAYIVTTMLEDVILSGTGTNANIGRPAAGKTGTTSSYRDAWFVGFTPDLVTAVWLGNDDYTPMNESYGGNIPARIWARFMRNALENVPKHDFTFPVGEIQKVVYCGSTRYEYFLPGTAPGGCASGTYYSQRRAYAQPPEQPQPGVPGAGLAAKVALPAAPASSSLHTGSRTNAAPAARAAVATPEPAPASEPTPAPEESAPAHANGSLDAPPVTGASAAPL